VGTTRELSDKPQRWRGHTGTEAATQCSAAAHGGRASDGLCLWRLARSR